MTPADPHTPALDPTAANGPPAAPTPDPLAEPTFEECIEEWNRYYDDRKAGKVSVRVAPDGHHVAYYAGRIHDHDADPNAHRTRVAAALGVHPAILVIDYPWMW